MAKHKKRLWSYWYEHYKAGHYRAVWQVIPSANYGTSLVRIKLIQYVSEDGTQHPAIDDGGEMPFCASNFDDEDVWTPIKKEDVPIILLRICDDYT